MQSRAHREPKQREQKTCINIITSILIISVHIGTEEDKRFIRYDLKVVVISFQFSYFVFVLNCRTVI